MVKSIRVKLNERNISKIVSKLLFLREILGLVSLEIYGDLGGRNGCVYDTTAVSLSCCF